MNQSEMYEIPVAVGKEVAYVRVYRDEQDRQVLVGFTDGTELAIDVEVRSVTSAVLYKITPGVSETIQRFDEPPSEHNSYSAVIRASTKRLA
ncbi:hypothetical protein [Granulicella arctica]|uniref:hypothetical protein n=1 Tax=Granulicella arctica TaxID=940613 RepID=UPI0021DF63E8|nr:hypothetical protein [Granulicella arctica]